MKCRWAVVVAKGGNLGGQKSVENSGTVGKATSKSVNCVEEPDGEKKSEESLLVPQAHLIFSSVGVVRIVWRDPRH